MNVQKLTDEINKRIYILESLNPELLSMLSRQNRQKLNISKLTDLRNTGTNVPTR
jgi:hypothetical protein